MQAVIFDFDGLILDTETAEVASWQQIFRSYGVEYPEWYWKFVLGRGAEQVTQRPVDLLLEQGIDIDPEAVVEARNKILWEMINDLEPLPGVLDRISEARELEMGVGIASSSKHAWVDGHLERIGLLNQFDVIVCADDVARAKPFPDPYLKACERLQVLPRDAMAFEDSPNGVAAAKAERLYVIAVPNSISRNFSLEEADQIVDSLAQVSIAAIRAT